MCTFLYTCNIISTAYTFALALLFVLLILQGLSFLHINESSDKDNINLERMLLAEITVHQIPVVSIHTVITVIQESLIFVFIQFSRFYQLVAA